MRGPACRQRGLLTAPEGGEHLRLLLAHDFEMGDRGKARREALGLTVADVARRMRCSVQRVYNLEAQGCGGLAVLKRWAAAIEMDPSELAFGPVDLRARPGQAHGMRARPVQRSRSER